MEVMHLFTSETFGWGVYVQVCVTEFLSLQLRTEVVNVERPLFLERVEPGDSQDVGTNKAIFLQMKTCF